MAVEVKYVVIREGEEKMSFTSKKEADAYDKMLDTADLLDAMAGRTKRCAEHHSENRQITVPTGRRC